MLAFPRDESAFQFNDHPSTPLKDASQIADSSGGRPRDESPDPISGAPNWSSNNMRGTVSPKVAELPQLTPATAEILARVNGTNNNGAHGTQFTSFNGTSNTASDHRPLISSGSNNVAMNTVSNFNKAATAITFTSTLVPKSAVLSSQTHLNHNVSPQPVPSPGNVASNTSTALPSVNSLVETPRITLKVSQPTPQVNASPQRTLDDAHSTPYTPPPINFVHSNMSGLSSAAHNTPEVQSRTSGKGLGRGRPGIPRGPRIKGTKRKRSEESDDEIHKSKSSPSDESESDDYSPQETQTKSGRQVHRPSQFVPPESPQSNRSQSQIKTKKRVITKGKEQNVLCEHCLRGNGPLGNAIVFCDGCNRAWHQSCHEPQISRQVVMDTERDWYCAECNQRSASMATKKKVKLNGENTDQRATTGVAEPFNRPKPHGSSGTSQNANPMTFVGGREISCAQQRQYLDTLSKEQLIQKVLEAAQHHPNIPLFPNSIVAGTPPSQASAPPTKTTITNTSMPPPTHKPTHHSPPIPSTADAEDSEDEYIYDEHALLYPKAGHGIKLPPESEDLHILLEGPDSKTFSHMLRPDVRPVKGMATMGRRLGIGVNG